MKLLDRLRRFVESAPPGTLVPVDGLRKLLEEERENAATAPDRGMTAEEAAEWLHRALGGRKRKPAAVRKLMRTGYRGVVLESFRVGREVRTTEAALERFAGALRARSGGRVAESVATVGTDPGDEVKAYRIAYGNGAGTG